jgi:hypothetical protein
MLNVIMLSVVSLNVVMLSAVEPLNVVQIILIFLKYFNVFIIISNRRRWS